jgi:hypothetical protein
MANGNAEITWPRIVGLVLSIITLTQGVVFWSVKSLGTQIDDQTANAKELFNQKLERIGDRDWRLERRIEACEAFIRQHGYREGGGHE